MTDTHPFFRLVWRINGLIIFVVGILTIGVLIFLNYQLFHEIFGVHDVSSVINVESEQSGEIEQNWSYGSMLKVQGSPYLMLPLELKQNYKQTYYDKSASSTLNYLFVNGENNSEQNLLFDKNQYLINSYYLLSEPSDKNDSPVIAILFQVIKTDSNEDKRLSHADLVTIGISKPNGTAYQEIISNVNQLVGHQMIDKNTLLLLYHEGQDIFSVHIDLTDFSLRNKVMLPKQPLVGIH
ncbi:hypothetical protein [Candidatus Albibeggiatoa sp. nov. BB20]|uniref:hypothetical protein n=1 Tax=Candidatus Albibeggiatoa sp. nov. BB20 TaxID=3162723 RepID=UPI003365A6C2